MSSLTACMARVGGADSHDSPGVEYSPELLREVCRLSETLKEKNLQALASTAKGLEYRILVIRQPAGEGEPWVLLDPVLESVGVSRSDEMEECLCLPELRVRVPRSGNIVLRAQTLSQVPVRFAAGGNLARSLQHELDHMDGILPTQRLAKEVRATLPDSVLSQGTHCPD